MHNAGSAPRPSQRAHRWCGCGMARAAPRVACAAGLGRTGAAPAHPRPHERRQPGPRSCMGGWRCTTQAAPPGRASAPSGHAGVLRHVPHRAWRVCRDSGAREPPPHTLARMSAASQRKARRRLWQRAVSGRSTWTSNSQEKTLAQTSPLYDTGAERHRGARRRLHAPTPGELHAPGGALVCCLSRFCCGRREARWHLPQDAHQPRRRCSRRAATSDGSFVNTGEIHRDEEIHWRHGENPNAIIHSKP